MAFYYRGFATIIFAVLITPSAAICEHQGEAMPLVVEKAWIATDATTGRTDQGYVTVRNSGERVIVAWGFWAEIKLSDGSSIRNGNSLDAARSPQQLRREVLPPNTSYTQKLALVMPPTAVDIIARPTFVVFDDDTTLGDESAIAMVFQRRAVVQRFWHSLQKIAADVTSKIVDPDAALRAIETELSVLADPEIRSTPEYTSVQQNLAMVLDPRLKQNKHQGLQRIVQESHSRLAEADAHVQRRR